MIVKFSLENYRSFFSKQTLSFNRKVAQLLAITHNTNLLSRMLEKDQVWFTEKDKKQSTSLYPLLSFEGESVDLEREYFAGHYGALPYVDYWKSFEE